MTRKESVDEAMLDTRTIRRHLAAGRVTPEEVARHLASLEDSADQAAWTATRMTSGAGVNVAPTEEENEEDVAG
jgi:hypothetical protein